MTQACMHFVVRCAALAAHHKAFVLALGLVLGWGAMGLLAGFSGAWLAMAGMGSGIVMCHMIILIHHTRTRNAANLQRGFDALVTAVEGKTTGPVGGSDGGAEAWRGAGWIVIRPRVTPGSTRARRDAADRQE